MVGHERLRDDHGTVIVSWVILMPFVVTLTFIGLQLGLYFAGRGVAIDAARAGAREARTSAENNPSWRLAAQDKAQDRVNQLAPELFDEITITAITPGPDQVGIRITAEIPSPMPDFLPLTSISVSSAGEIERFVSDVG